jgi:hypothetical protein
VTALTGLYGLAALTFGFLDFGPVLLLAGLTFVIAAVSLRQIPASDPPSIAGLTRLGRRVYGLVLKEGYVFTFPFLEDLIIESRVPETRTLEFAAIPTLAAEADGTANTQKRSGGSVKAKVMFVYLPDINDAAEEDEDHDGFNKFLNSGGRGGVNAQTEGMTGGTLRKYGSKKTWESMAFAKAEISADLIEMMTGETIPGRNADGSISDDAVKQYLDKTLTNGIADVHDLGIKIKRIEVIAIDPEGGLGEDAELEARETQQRRAERKDIETEAELAMIHIEKSKVGDKPTVTYKEALEYVRLRRNKNSSENIVRSSGNPILDAATVFGNNQQK